jgi:small GTP-binding protein
LVALYQAGWLLWWLIGAALATVVGLWLWVAGVRASVRVAADSSAGIAPEVFWSERDLVIWQRIRARTSRIEQGTEVLQTTGEAYRLFAAIAEQIAKYYHPTSRNPLLEIKAIHLLQSLELLVFDLQILFVRAVPFHDVLTVQELLGARQSYQRLQQLYNVYRVIRPFTNPLSAVVGEIRGIFVRAAVEDMTETSTRLVTAQLADVFARHAINLYSGQVVSRSDRPTLHSSSEVVIAEDAPIRVLIVGEVNAGKSSLVNACSGQLSTPVSPLPETSGDLVIEQRVGDLGLLHLIDTQGYGGDNATVAEQRLAALDTADVLIVVSPATSAARVADAKLLAAARSKRIPALVVVTKVDLLRPLHHWEPPYNVLDPTFHTSNAAQQKAASIRECVLHIANELSSEPHLVIPLCLRTPDEPYNLDAVFAALLEVLPDAKSRTLRRVIHTYLADQRVDEFWQSLRSSGRMLISAGESAVRTLARLGGTLMDDPRKRGE